MLAPRVDMSTNVMEQIPGTTGLMARAHCTFTSMTTHAIGYSPYVACLQNHLMQGCGNLLLIMLLSPVYTTICAACAHV